jgi:predicted nucleic acid-binding protein
MIFVDTWAWVALACRRDQYHAAARAIHDRFRREKYVTSHPVLAETITHLYRSIDATAAATFINAILQAAGRGDYLIVDLSPDRFTATWEMRKRYLDKPDISFVDFSSAIIARELGIMRIFSADQHFLQMNMGFELLAGA